MCTAAVRFHVLPTRMRVSSVALSLRAAIINVIRLMISTGRCLASAGTSVGERKAVAVASKLMTVGAVAGRLDRSMRVDCRGGLSSGSGRFGIVCYYHCWMNLYEGRVDERDWRCLYILLLVMVESTRPGLIGV